jgi:predicted phage-related endonuclease
MNIDSIMKELAEYIRMQEEAAAMVESLKDQLKERMSAAGVEFLAGSEHKATYKAVTSSRVDTTALKKELPEVAARYTKTTTTRRFTFA